MYNEQLSDANLILDLGIILTKRFCYSKGNENEQKYFFLVELAFLDIQTEIRHSLVDLFFQTENQLLFKYKYFAFPFTPEYIIRLELNGIISDQYFRFGR